MSGALLGVIAAIFILPIALLVWWSLGKSARLKQRQLEQWTPVAQQLGGQLVQHEGRWNHHVLQAPIHGVQVTATISHKVAADANIASTLRTNNEFRTQVHAPVAKPGPTFFVSGTRPGKGQMSFGDGEFRQRFRVDQDGGFESVASPEAQALLLELWPHFSDGAQLVSGGNIVSLLFNSNTTDAAAVDRAVRLVGAVAAA
jgi:hypothetical protein